MNHVIQLRISAIRSRDEVISILVPKMLGILWEAGQPEKFSLAPSYGRVNALIGSDGGRIWTGAFVLGPENFGLDVYAPTVRSPITKVFSASIGTCPSGFCPPFTYWNGRCGILSWRRGPWE